jgi:hypothetical protein
MAFGSYAKACNIKSGVTSISGMTVATTSLTVRPPQCVFLDKSILEGVMGGYMEVFVV